MSAIMQNKRLLGFILLESLTGNFNVDGHRAHYTAGLYTVFKPFNNVCCVYYSKVCVCVNISMISSLIKSIDHHSADFK